MQYNQLFVNIFDVEAHRKVHCSIIIPPSRTSLIMGVPRAGPAEQLATILTRDLLNLEMHVLDVTLKGLPPYTAGPAKYPGADVTLYCCCSSWRRVVIFEHQMVILI